MIESDVDEFLGSLLLELRRSENTCTSYGRDLRLFVGHLKRKGIADVSQVGSAEIRGFLAVERDRGICGTTRARRMAAIRAFFRFLRERRRIAADPSAPMDAPRKEQTLPRVLSPEETLRMLNAIPGDGAQALRDRALLEVLYGCGLRVSELCRLTCDDLVGEGELLRVLGKGSKERIVPVGSSVGRALVAYLDGARGSFARGNLSERHLFLTRMGRPFTRQGVFKMVRMRAQAVGIAAERVSPHVLRHCFASHMLANKADIRAIQELLGHADISTTQVYTHVDRKRLIGIHQLHPRH